MKFQKNLIREKIKEIELNNKFKELNVSKYINDLIKNYSKRIGFENIDDFIQSLKLIYRN